MVFCSKCGNEETSDKSFCSKCGAKITNAEKDTPKSSSFWFGDDPKSGMYVKGEDGFFGRKNVNERKKIINTLILAMVGVMFLGFMYWVFT